MKSHLKPYIRRVVAWSGVAVALALVASAYFSPHLILDLGNRIWACF